MERPDWAPETIDLEQPSGARMYDYFLGGSHNFAVDREAAQKVIAAMPEVPLRAQANRAFLRRAVRFLMASGVRQFLDIGSGIPTVGNVHEVAQRLDPTSRVIYVDIDPIAVAHSQELLQDNPRALIIQEDLRNAEQLVAHPDVRGLLDFTEPIAVLMVAILHFLPDEAEPHRLVATIRDALPYGSYLVLTHGNLENVPEADQAPGHEVYRRDTGFYSRSRADIARFFDGFELVPPGLVWAPEWRPDSPSPFADPADSAMLGGVGRLRG